MPKIKTVTATMHKKSKKMDRVVVEWSIDQLKDHPRQDANFATAADYEIAELAADIARNGLRCPIEILPDGTIIKGHQRRRAALLLKWTSIDVTVRHDLADDSVATEQEMIGDNLHRRQLDKLDLARLYNRLIEIEPRGKKLLDRSLRVDLRDQLALRLGGSGRNLDRYRLILKTPREVQDAFQAGELNLFLAGKVAGLPHETQALIVEAIRNGEDPNSVVQMHMQTKPRLKTSVRIGYRRILRELETAMTLSTQLNEIPLTAISCTHLATIDAGLNFLRALRKHIQASIRKNQRS